MGVWQQGSGPKVCSRKLWGLSCACAGKPAAEPAGKPGSVVDSHSSRRNVTVTLKQPTRRHCGPQHSLPIWSCSRWGLPCRSVAGLAVRSYRTISPLPASRRTAGGIFLLHFPSARAAQALPGTVPCGARTFLGIVSDDATVWPAPPHALSHRARDWTRSAQRKRQHAGERRRQDQPCCRHPPSHQCHDAHDHHDQVADAQYRLCPQRTAQRRQQQTDDRGIASLFGLAPGGVCRAGLLPGSRCALTAPFHPCLCPATPLPSLERLGRLRRQVAWRSPLRSAATKG